MCLMTSHHLPQTFTHWPEKGKKMSGFVIVCKDEGKEDKVELPTEDDGSLVLSVLQSQFEGATGLKYKNPDTGSWRAVRISDNILHPPSEDGWGTMTYVVVGSVKGGDSDESGSGERGERSGRGSSRAGQKRSHHDDYDYSSKAHCHSPTSYYQQSHPVSDRASDLIVLGLHYDVDEPQLKAYFEQFGEVESCEVKLDHMTHRSRGFGFLRFKDPSIHASVMKMPHTINGRRCELRPPRKGGNSALPCKFFIGCLPTNPDTTTDELRAYFGQYGHVTDVFIPRPYRGFGFVTFLEGMDPHRMCQGEVHILRNSRLNVSVAEPRASSAGGSSHYSYRREGGSGMSSDYSSYSSYAAGSSSYTPGTQLYAIVPSYAAAQYYSTGGRTS